LKKYPVILVLMTSVVACGLMFVWWLNTGYGQTSGVPATIVDQALQESPELFFGGFVSVVMALIAGRIALHRLLKMSQKRNLKIDE
jgi:hypothetical protein